MVNGREFDVAPESNVTYRLSGFTNESAPTGNGKMHTTQRRKLGGFESLPLSIDPAREDVDVLSVFADYDHPQRAAIEQTPPGSVLVVDCRNEPRAASAGSILLTRLMVRGAAGFVTDGSLRDVETISQLDLPTFAHSSAATTNLALHHAVDLQVPIACAGVPVYPGDVIVSDRDGVVCIPRHLAAEIAAPAAAQERLEDFIMGKVRAGAPLRGVYPPDTATLEEYRSTRGPQDGIATGE
jgi:regulator of RNase E activity RraA